MAIPMPREVVEERISAINEYGGNLSKAAIHLGIGRTTLQNTVAAAKRYGMGGTIAQSHAALVKSDIPGRLEFVIENGVVLVGSDAHYYPGIISAAHRALVSFCREMRPALVIMNGDLLDGAGISRHPPIGWSSTPKLIDELEAVRERLGEITVAADAAQRAWCQGNHDCLDSETQCLTRRGWVNYDDIVDTDHVLSLADGVAIWSRIDEIVKFAYDDVLVRVDKRDVSMAVTPNHRVLLRRLDWRSGRYEIEEYRYASNLPSSFNLPVSAITNHKGSTLTDDQIMLAGWVLTDGGHEKYAISIYQSKPETVVEINNLLDRLGINYSRYERTRDIEEICGKKLLSSHKLHVRFRMPADEARKIWEWLPPQRILPEWANDLSHRQFHILLDTIVAGDGSWDGKDPSQKQCATVYKDQRFLSSLQAIAVQHGWRARLTQDNRGHWVLRLLRISESRVEKPEVWSEQYRGTVWCLRVPHGNFMVRRRGCAYFTGNSRFDTKLASMAPEYAGVRGIELADHFDPDWQKAWSVWINNTVTIKHRIKGGTHATHNNTLHAGISTVTGHLHSLKVTPFTDYRATRWGVDCGSLATPYGPQFEYMEDSPRSWRSGFAVLTFRNYELLWPEIVWARNETEVEFRGQVISV